MAERQLLLGAYFTGAERVAWQHPDTVDLIDMASIATNARIADEALFHFHFMAEALHVAETGDQVAWHTVNGRHDVMTVHAMLGGVTRNLALISTLNTTYHDPYDTARKLATMDLLNGGRTGVNIVSSQLPATAANFSRGNHVAYPQRYERAQAFLDVVRGTWAGLTAEQPYRADHPTTGSFAGRGDWPAAPQAGGPLVLTANFSGDGAAFSARNSDGVFMLPRTREDAQANYAMVKARLAEYGRDERDVKMIVGTDVVLGSTRAEAHERYHHLLDLEITAHDVVVELEKVWRIDLSDLDPDGPLPDREPDYAALGDFLVNAPGVPVRDPHLFFRGFTERARAEGLTCRETVKRQFVRRAFIGTPGSVAEEMQSWLNTRAADGFIIQPHVVPSGLREFVDDVVPLLRERGVFRDEIVHDTVREAWRAA